MNINLKIRFNIAGSKTHDEVTEPDRPSVTGKRVRMKNTNTETTHQETADNAETILGTKK